jgi:lipoprotein-anchoring transpeptidase ErfK/SrfK
LHFPIVVKVLLAIAVALMSADATLQRTVAPIVSDTVAAQVMLDRAGFSPGEIDGRLGLNLRNALSAFQRANGIPPSADLNEATWQTLRERADAAPPLVPYSVKEADIAGPFSPAIPADLMEQSKLPSLGYQNALEALAERFHLSPQLLRALNPHATFDRAGEQLLVPNVASPAPLPEAKATIVVTKSTSALTIEDEDARVIFYAPVTTGSRHDPLPIGAWKVTGVQRSPSFHYNPDLFWDADPRHSKATIPPGPNNPVGTAWIDLSKAHYGIHGTPEPSRIGHVQSHGCIRMTNWDVQRVAEWARPGTPVVFRE